MNSTLTELQKRLIDEIALAQDFKYYNLCSNQGSLKGDGYMGTITVIIIEEKLTNRKLHLILKAAQPGDELRKKTPVRSAFIRENFMYNVLFKEISELQKEYKVKDVFDGTAKFYGGLEDLNEECLVLENLKEIGFTMWNRRKPMDSHHVGAVMAQYGKFHAFSYVLKKLKPEKYAEITKNVPSIFENMMDTEEMKESTISAMERAFRAVEGNREATAGLRRFFEISNMFFKQCMQMKDEYTVITHGDCWCNNLMFKYEATNSQKPSKVYLLDWQLSTTGSPILDISYFFYVCSSKLCMDNYNSYLKIYFDSLTAMLKQFGMKVDEIMTFKDLQLQWRIYAKYGMYMAFLIIKIMLAEQEEAPDLKDMVEDNKNIINMFDVQISNEKEYNKRINIVINHMVKNKFI